MTGKKIGYVRVSSFDQNPERQLEGVILDKKFTDKASGKDSGRLHEILLMIMTVIISGSELKF
jgi:DNA invertase Pin-like site-specific DNA recombinase